MPRLCATTWPGFRQAGPHDGHPVPLPQPLRESLGGFQKVGPMGGNELGYEAPSASTASIQEDDQAEYRRGQISPG